MAKDGTTGPVSNMDGGTFKSSEEVRMENTRDLTQSEAIIDELGEGLGKLLVDAGFVTILSIQTATDEDLLAISGIGKAKLAEIREATVGSQSLATLTPEELVPEPDIPEAEAETPEVVEPAPEVGDSLETLDEAFEREAPPDESLPVDEYEARTPESEEAVGGLGIIDDSVVPSPADLEAQGEIIPELANLEIGPGEPAHIQEYVPPEDEDILPELADLEIGPPAQLGMAMMPTVVEPLGVSSRIARIQQTAAEQAVEDARVAEAVRKNAIEQATKEAERATKEAEDAANEAVKETRIAEVSEVLRESEASDILHEPGNTPEDAPAGPLAGGEVAGDAPIVHATLDSEVIGEGTVEGGEKSGGIIQKVQEMEENLEPKGGPISIPPDVADAIVEETAEVGEPGPEEVEEPEPDKSEDPTSE